MEVRELTCIGCPMGCQITVHMDGKEVLSVEGNTCKRGDDYARKEVTNPTRIVTSSVVVEGATSGMKMVSCKTAQDIPKEKIFDVLEAIKNVTVKAPIKVGQVLVSDVAKTGVDIIATREVL